jgi:hypothetical protein
MSERSLLQLFRSSQVQRIHLILTDRDLGRSSVAESPIQRIANRLVAHWIERVTHTGNNDSVGIWHFGARNTEGKVKRNEVVVSSVDDGQGNSADNFLRHGAGRLRRVPFWIDPHVGMTFSKEPTELGTGQRKRNERADSKRNPPIGWTRDHDNSRQFRVCRSVGQRRDRPHRGTNEGDTRMTTACLDYSRGNVVALHVAEGTETSGLAVSTSIVRKNVEESGPDALGQPNDVRVILRRGQTVHEDDNGPRFTIERPGAGRELHTVSCQQPRALKGHFGHLAPLGRPKRRRACTR